MTSSSSSPELAGEERGFEPTHGRDRDSAPESGTHRKFLSRSEQTPSGTRLFHFDSCHGHVNIYIGEILESAIEELEPMARSELSTALRELLLNAIEHGNFEFGYGEKSAALLDGSWVQAIARRSIQEPFRSRRVHVRVEWSDWDFCAVIGDEGFGFDWRNLPDPSAAENLLSEHGRGVTLARFCVDELFYNETGNEVTIRKRLLPAYPTK